MRDWRSPSQKLCGYVRLRVATCGYVWLRVATCGYVWISRKRGQRREWEPARRRSADRGQPAIALYRLIPACTALSKRPIGKVAKFALRECDTPPSAAWRRLAGGAGEAEKPQAHKNQASAFAKGATADRLEKTPKSQPLCRLLSHIITYYRLFSRPGRKKCDRRGILEVEGAGGKAHCKSCAAMCGKMRLCADFGKTKRHVGPTANYFYDQRGGGMSRSKLAQRLALGGKMAKMDRKSATYLTTNCYEEYARQVYLHFAYTLPSLRCPQLFELGPRKGTNGTVGWIRIGIIN